MKKEWLVSVVVVVQDAEAALPDFIARISGVMQAHFKDYELVLVDNASRDRTRETIQQAQQQYKNLQYYALAPRVDMQVATIAGIDNAIGDVVITLDMQRDPPEKIPEMVEKASEGFEIVYGVDASRANAHSLYDRAAKIFYRLFSRINDLDIPREASSFRLLSRSVVNFITAIADRHHLLQVLPGITGQPYALVPYQSFPRSKYAPRSAGLLTKILEGFRALFAASPKPLRIASFTALIAGFLNLLYAVYVVVVALIKPDVAEGWVSLSLQSSGMFFLISLVLTIISEYLYGIMERTQERPLYTIAKESSSLVFQRKAELNVVESVNK